MEQETRTRSIGSVPMYTESGETHIVQFKVTEVRVSNSPESMQEWATESKHMTTADSLVNFEADGVFSIATTGQLIYPKSQLPGADGS